jgi:hypothetical protein
MNSFDTGGYGVHANNKDALVSASQLIEKSFKFSADVYLNKNVEPIRLVIILPNTHAIHST